MKIFVISDIHGSYTCLEQFMKIYDEESEKLLIILGDILYHGPRNPLPLGYEPKKVIELLNNYSDQILWIKGNCDAEVDEMVLKFKASVNKKLILNDRYFYLTHGHHLEEVEKELEVNDVLLHGHTHVYYLKNENGIIKGNPGSLSLPKEHEERSYMVIEEDKIEIYSLEKELLVSLDI